jgi:hypothetical protein
VNETFAEGQMNIFLPAEPLFLPETPQIQALSDFLFCLLFDKITADYVIYYIKITKFVLKFYLKH